MGELLLRAAGLTGYVELARALGLDPFRMVAAEGLPGACLSDPDLRIPANAFGRLLERSAQRSGAIDFGLRLAETRNLSNLGIVGLVAREQPTLRQALETLIAYSWVQAEALSLRLDTDGNDVAVLRAGVVGSRSNMARQASELTLGVLVRTVRRLVGQAWQPETIYFSHSRPPGLATHRRVLGLVPQFDQEFDGLIFARRDLDAPVADADPVAAKRMQRYVELEAGDRRNNLVPTVQELIKALLPTGTCTIERVAKHMGITRRTLHRQLAGEANCTFTDLLNEVRIACAETYLMDGRLSLTEIAERLGYGSLSAFSRWRRHNRGSTTNR